MKDEKQKGREQVFQRRDKDGKLLSPYYYYRFTHDGAEYYRCTKVTDKKEAKRQFRIARKKAVAGELPRKKAGERLPTLKSVVERFQDEYKGRRGELRSKHYQTHLAPFLEDFGRKPLNEVTRANLEAYRNQRLADGRATSTVRKELIALGTVFRVARRWGYTVANPVDDVDKPSEPQHKLRYLFHDEWTASKEKAPKWLRPMLMVAVGTGMRLKEVTNVRWDDLDRENRQIYVQAANKTARARFVPLSEDVLRATQTRVRRFRAEHVFLHQDGRPYTSEGSRRYISRSTSGVFAALGISDASFHTLRHTFASWWVQDGGDLYELQRILGHSSIALTQRYAHLAPDFTRKAASRIDRFLSPGQGGPKGSKIRAGDGQARSPRSRDAASL